jgi:MoxR-like ATPase
VLRHRVLLSYEAEAQDLDSDSVLRDIFNTVDVP